MSLIEPSAPYGDSGRRVVAVIQARTGSTRLPKKVLRPIVGRQMILRIADRLRYAMGDDVVAAIADTAENDRLARVLDEAHVPVVRGPEERLVTRLLLAAESVQADAIVRITADCPMICPDVVQRVVGMWRQVPTLDYVSNIFPVRTWPDGEDCELYTTKLLRDIEQYPEAQASPAEFVWTHSDKLPHGMIPCPYGQLGHLRWTVDTWEDWRSIQTPFAMLPEGFTVGDVLNEYGSVSLRGMSKYLSRLEYVVR